MQNDRDNPDEAGELFEHFRFTVDKGQSPERIDKYLFVRLADASRNRLQNAARAGNILVNGKPVKPNYTVRPTDIITIVLAYPPRDTEIYPEEIPLEIVYEDTSLLVVNKPAGMVVHPGHGNFSGTLLNALLFHFRHRSDCSGPDDRPYLAHRIDKDTTGLLLIAKNELIQSKLAKQFFDHTVDRKYVALVWGDLPQDEGTFTGHLIRNPRERTIMSVTPDDMAGRYAITHYRVLERFGYVTLVECRLETGRTHQIRVHFSHAGYPLFNDSGYGGNRIVKGTTFTKYKQFVQNCFQMIPRQALHAKSLGFIHPGTKEAMFFDSPLPADLHDVTEKWRKYTNP